MNMKIGITALAVIAFVCVSALAPLAAALDNPANPTAKILVDMTHGERIEIDGTESNISCSAPYDLVVDVTAWANDMRGQGYAVDNMTTGEITASALSGYNMLAVICPDNNTVNGPAYFTQNEANAIKAYVQKGGGLLLIGDNLLGSGSQASDYDNEYDANYTYDVILNDLGDKTGFNVTFRDDTVCTDNASEKIGGPKGNLWISNGSKSHRLWKDPNTFTKFTAFHACSLDIDPNYDKIAWGVDTTYSTVKSSDYSPNVTEEGSFPVVMATEDFVNGTVVWLGDASMQGHVLYGDLYDKASYNLSKLHQNIAKYVMAIYDFNSGASTDKWAFKKQVGNSPTASQPNSEFLSADYGKIKKDDADRKESVTDTDGQYAAHRFNVSIDQAATNISTINVTWNGKGEHDSATATDGAKLYMYNFTAGSYRQLNSTTLATDVDLTGSVNTTLGISNYISSSNVTVLVNQTSAQKEDFGTKYSRIKTDYFMLVVTPKTT